MNLDEYRQRTDHFRHCAGAPVAEQWNAVQRRFQEVLEENRTRLPWHSRTNKAWTVCLHKAGIIDRETARKILQAAQRVEKSGDPGGGTERSMIEELGGDEDLGSIINYGRTLQEPMSRLHMRARILELFDAFHELMTAVLDVAEANVDTVMTGHTHFAHGQPITYAHYLLAVFDGLDRAAELLSLAYRHTDRNSGGCGSTSGTSWPVDRRLLTELLGFSETVEPTYDCEVSQDHSLALLYGLSNMALLVSRVALELEIWTMEEFALFDVDPGYVGQSSFMPHKAHPGSRLERIRVPAAEVLGETLKAVCLVKGEPLQDVIPMLAVPEGSALSAAAHSEVAMRCLAGFLRNCTPRKERMLCIVREGFSCSTEIAVHLIRELGYGGRRAHRITATFVRLCRERGINADESTGDVLDEAARFLGDKVPKVDTSTLRRLLDPGHFVETHTGVGGTAPQETRRMLAGRRKRLTDLVALQADRQARIQQGEAYLQKEIETITGN